MGGAHDLGARPVTDVLAVPPVARRKPRRTGARSADAVDRALGARLRALRDDAKLTRREVSIRLGVTAQQIQKYEEGVDRLSIGRLVRFADLLGVGAEELVKDLAPATDAIFDDARVAGRHFLEKVKLLRLFDSLPPELRTAMLDVAESLAATHELVMRPANQKEKK
jgi:transcriptional regulator with XRE-family HTH domain